MAIIEITSNQWKERVKSFKSDDTEPNRSKNERASGTGKAQRQQLANGCSDNDETEHRNYRASMSATQTSRLSWPSSRRK